MLPKIARSSWSNCGVMIDASVSTSSQGNGLTGDESLDRTRAVHIVLSVISQEGLRSLQSVSRDDVIDKAQLVRLRRVQLLRLQEHLKRLLATQNLRQSGGTAPSLAERQLVVNKADIALLAILHHSEVGAGRDFRSASNGISLNQTDADQSKTTKTGEGRLHEQIQLQLPILIVRVSNE